jgi:membrane protein DedA with SNARE-associated domain
MRVSFLTLDAVFLVLFLSFLIRDHFSPPANQDQRILHYMSLGCAAFFSIAGALLLWDRSRQDAPKH